MMKRIHVWTILLTGGMLLGFYLSPAACRADEMSSAAYTIKTDVLSSGGSMLLSSNYQMASTIGQPSPIGISRSTSYTNQPGFWFRSATGSAVKNKNILWLVLPAILSGAGE